MPSFVPCSSRTAALAQATRCPAVFRTHTVAVLGVGNEKGHKDPYPFHSAPVARHHDGFEATVIDRGYGKLPNPRYKHVKRMVAAT